MTHSTRSRFTRRSAAAAVLALALLFAGCNSKKDTIPQSDMSISEPYQEFGKSTMHSYEGPHKIWRLDTDYMRKGMSDTARMLVVPVRLTIFDTTGRQSSRVLADSGTTSPNRDDFFVWGNVYIRTMNGQIIKSESLWWNRNTHKVGSDEFVEITTPAGDVLRGKGLDANESFSNWSLRDNVSGEFPNFKERMESDEE
jgi:LPS export ABC transporter protein LptC